MKKTIFKGAGVALVTPMENDGSVNYETLGKLIDFQLENQTDAIISCGTTGESATLTAAEHSKVIEFTINRVNGKIPVIAGTGSNCTAKALQLSKEAEKLGADGLLIVTPYYNKTSQKGLVSHYNLIADSISTPIILYNVPSRTGVNIKPETYQILSKHPNIVAAKEANGDISSVAKTISLCGEDLNIYSGNDDQIVPMLSLGAIGVISVLSNVCPKQCHEIVSKYLSGEVKESAKMQLEYIKLIEMLFCDVNPIPVKAAMNMMGYPCGKCRLPLENLNEAQTAELKNAMKKHNLI